MICPVKEHVYWCWWHFCPNCTIRGEVVSTPQGRMGTQEGGLPPMHGPCLRHQGRSKNTLFGVPRYSIRSNRSISSTPPQLSALGPSRADDGTRTSGACADMGGAHAVVLACVWKRPLAFLWHCPSRVLNRGWLRAPSCCAQDKAVGSVGDYAPTALVLAFLALWVPSVDRLRVSTTPFPCILTASGPDGENSPRAGCRGAHSARNATRLAFPTAGGGVASAKAGYAASAFASAPRSKRTRSRA